VTSTMMLMRIGAIIARTRLDTLDHAPINPLINRVINNNQEGNFLSCTTPNIRKDRKMPRLQIFIGGQERLGADIEEGAQLHEALGELAKSLKAVFDGKSKPMRFNDSQRADRRPIICMKCELEIPKYETYTYTVGDEGEDIPYHSQCHPNT